MWHFSVFGQLFQGDITPARVAPASARAPHHTQFWGTGWGGVRKCCRRRATGATVHNGAVGFSARCVLASLLPLIHKKKKKSCCRDGENWVGDSPGEAADGKAAGKRAAFERSDAPGADPLGRVQSGVLAAVLAPLQRVCR